MQPTYQALVLRDHKIYVLLRRSSLEERIEGVVATMEKIRDI